MRMRRKKNLEEKLLECSDILLSPVTDDRNYNTANDTKEYFDYKELFGNDNKVELEIGCGKGQFICEKAKQNPDTNFLAVELNANVIMLACKKAKSAGVSNVKFVKCRAEYLPKYITPNSIERIYLNFSCPFPKKKYASHRLTNSRFLEIYKSLLAPKAEIHQKTDNMHFFEYSIEEFSQNGFALKNVTLNLHGSQFEGNIMTEYEKRFTDLGQPIYRLEAYLK